jgi:2-keto-4-pentenoate hydratase
MNNPQQTAAFLLDHRARQDPVDNIPEPLYPPSLADAFEVQQQVVAARLAENGAVPCGYKIACTNQRVIELLNVSGPFPGRLMSHSTHAGGVTLHAADFRLRIMEAEFGFELGSDVPLAVEPYTADSIRPFIAAFIPALEIVDHSFNDFTRVGEEAIIADNAIHGAAVFGKPVRDWRDIDFIQYPISLVVNGRTVSSGNGGNVLGDPLNALAWLANHLAARGIVLRAGERVLTGTAAEIHLADAGESIIADFGEHGAVSLSFQ